MKHMSRIGNAIIIVPKEASIVVDVNRVIVKGPKGELQVPTPEGITVSLSAEGLTIARSEESKAAKALHGFVRANLANAVVGVTKGWTKTLELSGVGFRAAVSGADLVLTVGFSHSITVSPPPGIVFTVVEGKINVTGIDKHAVGQVAANIRAYKKPEPYKGKGIKYVGEHIRKKAGKAAKAIGGAPGAK